ncbi:MAG: alpha-1,4-glucan--maltose-1-phosphate maltosyltransferase [Alphaproteobacteria bacterium]
MRLAETRIAIEDVSPVIDGGRFPAKAVVGRPFVLEADIFCDGHDVIGTASLVRPVQSRRWTELPMQPLGNDRWRAVTTFDAVGLHEFTLQAWRDLFASWQAEVAKKHAAGMPISLELREGLSIVERTLQEAGPRTPQDKTALRGLQAKLQSVRDEGGLFALLMTGETTQLMRRVGIRTNLSTLPAPIPVWVDRERAQFSAWYELMPRSMSFSEERHGTFDDVVKHLPYVRDLGFDVLYFPPIHPIGRTNRKGRNNSLTARPDDPGSPYAIGAPEGGHTAIHPALGTFQDFKRLVDAARAHGLEVALDFAIQCSRDHPWIKQHPEWFDWRPDGTIKFAENPPKKYEDIVNVHFYRDAIPSLWIELRDVVLFWIDHGVKIFRVDNPHTKPLPFWEWMIAEVREQHPDVIFLAEAFTRPKMMKRLAKVGFSQSYSYFTWRDTKQELIEYLTELTSGTMPYVMQPNFFVNTPDINPYYLQTSGRAGFRVRLVLAATLSTSYGVYNGFEICESAAVPGKEEYLDSEKYQLRAWDFDKPGNIKEDIRLVNRLRNRHPALQQFAHLKFYNAWNDHVLYYAKFTPDLSDFLLIAVNLDPVSPQGAAIEVPLWEFGLPDDAAIDAHDLVTGSDFRWEGKMQHVWLTPEERPYAIWQLHNPAFASK